LPRIFFGLIKDIQYGISFIFLRVLLIW